MKKLLSMHTRHTKQVWLVYSMVALPVMLAGSALADDWPQWRGANRDAKSSETGLFSEWTTDGPPLVFRVSGLGQGYAGVSVVGDLIFTTGNLDGAQVVTAVSKSRNEIVWQTPITNRVPQHSYEGSRCTPTVDGNKLYVVSSSGAITCLDAKSGRFIWNRDFADWEGRMMSGWGYSESPLVDGNLVLCTPGGRKGMVVALDKATGNEVWACTMPKSNEDEGVNGKALNDGAAYSSIVKSNGGGVSQYIQLVGRGLIGVRASDGKLLWKYTKVANGTANIPTAIVQDDFVFTSTAYNTGSALLRLESNGTDSVKVEEVYWLEADLMQNKHGGMVLVDGYIYSGTGNGQGLPICVEMETGERTWGPVRGEGSGESSLIYADGHLVIRRDDGTVMLVKANPQSFELVHHFKPEFQEGKSWAHPVISSGVMYLREQDVLMAYKVK